MVSLSNQARLLAAQAFNKKVLEDKARAKQAEIDAEARKQEQKRFERQRQALARQTVGQSANVVAFQQKRLEDDIKRQQATKAEVARVAQIRKTAEVEKAKVFSRVAKGGNIGVLTGFEAIKDTRGRTVGISNKESATRKNTRKLLLREIQQQQQKASRETDLERFLKNERAINSGQVGLKELNRQIATRKARGLSKTPAQKRASQGFRDFGLQTALSARSKRKGGSGVRADGQTVRASFGGILSERARADELGSSPFADPLFNFGGRTKAQQVARGGTFGARAGGQSISSQLNFISQTKARSTSARIGFASSLLAGLDSGGIFSGGSSQQSLLGFVKQKKIATPKTFEQELSSGVGFFTTVQAPVTKPKLTKGQRGKLVKERKFEDKVKADTARATISATKSATRKAQRANVDDLSRLSDSLLSFNTERGRSIEAQNALAPPRFSLGLGVSVQRQQAQTPRQLEFIPTRSAFTGTTERVAKGQKLTPSQKRKQAEATQRETQLLRDTPFQVGGLVQATGRPSSTETFFPSLPARREGSIFDVGLSENLGISDVLSPTPTRSTKTRSKKGTKARTTAPRTPRVRDDFGVLDIGRGGGSGEAQALNIDLGGFGGVGFGGVGEVAGGLTRNVTDFFALPSARAQGVDFSDPILQAGISEGGSFLRSGLPKGLQNLFG